MLVQLILERLFRQAIKVELVVILVNEIIGV